MSVKKIITYDAWHLVLVSVFIVVFSSLLLTTINSQGSTALTINLQESTEWIRHSIDTGTSLGADGTRLADVDGDGDMDITTPWEEKGHIKAYLNPGPGQNITQLWESVIAGRVRGPEDSVFADLDNDGAVDVVSSAEGAKALYVHWAPKDAIINGLFNKNAYLNSSLWTTEPIAESSGSSWMFALPMDVDGKNGIDLVGGGKSGASVGWFESPENPRNTSQWKFHPLHKLGWIMSMSSKDMDGDNDTDVLLSARTKGSFWIENPGHTALQQNPDMKWPLHRIGSYNRGLSMFQTSGDLDQDGIDDVVLANRDYAIIFHKGNYSNTELWDSYIIGVPGKFISGTPKGVAIGDINLDNKTDLVVTAEHTAVRTGVWWMSSFPVENLEYDPIRKAYTGWVWDFHKVSGNEEKNGAKFDLVELVDLDNDGDLDIITSEEAHNLGVVWYENPTIKN